MPKRRKKLSESDKRLLNLIFLNIFLIASGFLWLDYLGLISFNEDILPAISKIPGVGKVISPRAEDPYLLAKEEQKKVEYAKKMEWEKLDEKEEQLKSIALALTEKERALKEQQERLKEKEKEIDNKYAEKQAYKKEVEQQATYLVGMKPDDAVARLSIMDDILIIDILRAIEKKAQLEGQQSIVPYYLSLMDPKKASVIQRKMTVVEEDVEE